jgi:hypothetical protein
MRKPERLRPGAARQDEHDFDKLVNLVPTVLDRILAIRRSLDGVKKSLDSFVPTIAGNSRMQKAVAGRRASRLIGQMP